MLCVNRLWQLAEKYAVRLWIIYGYGHLFAPVYFKDGVWKRQWNHARAEDAISQLWIWKDVSLSAVVVTYLALLLCWKVRFLNEYYTFNILYTFKLYCCVLSIITDLFGLCSFHWTWTGNMFIVGLQLTIILIID